jgi:4a-hydroxytetrahydrobiopterin dehydratase
MKHYTSKNFSDALGTSNSEWKWKSDALEGTYTFSDFKMAFAFMTQVAEVAERMQHHPDWHNSYNTVVIRLYTHDLSAVTDLDISLAREISALVKT